MADFKTQIRAVTGLQIGQSTTPDEVETSVMLNHSIIDVINKVKSIDPSGYSTFASVTSTGSGVGARIDGEIVGVYGKDGEDSTKKYPATEIDFAISAQASNSASIHYQSKYNPAYYRQGRDVYIIPDGGDVLHVVIPTTTLDDDSIYSMPDQYTRSVVLGAAIRVMERNIQYLVSPASTLVPIYTIDASLFPSPGMAYGAPPSPINVPTLTYASNSLIDEHTGTTISRTKIDAELANVLFTPTPLEVVTLNLPDDLVLPSAPVPPSETAITLNFTDTPPAYTMPAQEMETFPDITEFALDATTILPSAMHAPTFNAPTVGAITIGTLPGPPVYGSPKLLGVVEELMQDTIGATVDISEDDAQSINTLLEAAWSYIVEEEDPEQFGTVNQFIGTVLNLYTNAVQDKMNLLNSHTQEYNQEVAKVMQQAQMDQTAALKQDDMDWAEATAQYTQELSQHQADIARYNADVQQQIQEWTLKNLTYEVEVWNKKQVVKFTEFTNNMANEMNRFNVDSAAYTANYNMAVKNAELEGADQAAKFQKYDKDMAQHTAEVNAKVQEYQQNALAKVIEIYKFDRGQALSEYQALTAERLNLFNEAVQRTNIEIQIAQSDASAAQASLQALMAASTDLEKHNSLQQIQAETQNFTNQLNYFSQEMAAYQADVNTANTERTAELNVLGSHLTDSMNAFNTKFQTFQNEMSYKEKVLASLRMDYAMSLGLQQKEGE